ncbi:GspE/PulE family protein [Absiella sp. AM54-8XD]|uniref:Flp pilus assembly complex ATPase component TadA n=2 Tax=Amedibacillus TaxID=2749846 RepID=A0A7G9GMY8_9FIRM|nr:MULTISPECIES: GspE/PulE family protein [Bacillota]QNM12170.1 Flp pilus assembly complex ATPase component TadA [[Eubacterium] hominis]MCH4287348.1 GspE/PulE family protein [Amedibacillus hominis]RGB48437.1 GspE/PulE family protein [Absiella sp. AM22-9]RGB51420.1 GspE/PulE family protein [Absiella sp. AM10-20]RGC21783.1 GspE/PulE family protein [Absiella sp. AM54-8XD]
MKNIPIGEVLKEYGYINEDQLQTALAEQKKDRSRRLGQHLIDLGFITEKQMLKALSDKLNEPIVDLNTSHIEVDAVAKIPKALALKYDLIAITEQNGVLTVVTSDPLNFYGIEDVRLVTGLNLSIGLCEKAEILKAIDYYYAEIKAREAATAANQNVTSFEFNEEELFNSETDDTPIVKLFNSLLSRGYNQNASDIHIEAYEDKTMVRMRIDGMIVDYVQLAKNLHASLIVRIKIMANMDIAEKRLPQDGHFVTTIDGVKMNLRVSIIPTSYGEKAVLRFLNSNTTIMHNKTYGMIQENYEKICKMLEMPHGIIYFTGPTGSGKTTTLYMILETLAKRQINISTIEDPVEKNIERCNQMQINNMAGLDFEMGLRALLRQDPDVILVGETRDGETASISVRAAITGHLVLSSLHTNDAISTIVRLEDMGVEPFMVANSLIGSISQRLVKTICPHCKEKISTTELDRSVLGEDVKYIYKGAGCHLCNHTGYKGRTAIHEVIMIDKEVRKMISNKIDIDDIYAYVKTSQNLKTLRDQAIDYVKQGITTMDELYKITSYLD